MTVSPPQRMAQTSLSTSSPTEELTRSCRYWLILTRKLFDRHRLDSGWLMLAMMARLRATSSRTNSGVTWSGMVAPKDLPPRAAAQPVAAEVLANGDVFHPA